VTSFAALHTGDGGGVFLPDERRYILARVAEGLMGSGGEAAFTAADTHGRALRSGNRLIAHSEGAGWRSLYAAIMVEGPFEAAEVALDHPSFIYHLSRPTEVTRKIEGRATERDLIVPRRITLTPGRVATRWHHAGQPQILQVYLRQSVFESAAAEMFGGDPAGIEIAPRFAMTDPLLEQLAVAVHDTVHDASRSALVYVDTLAQMVAAHLAKAHSSAGRPTRTPVPAGLSDWRLRHLAELIEANLDGDLSLETMATTVGLSPLYLIRAFKSAFGEPPHRYVLRRRIERARLLLRTTDMPVAEVALAVGFSSQSHLSSWFQRLVGTSPAAFRRQQ
jgi:AraC family transcriptional regulator